MPEGEHGLFTPPLFTSAQLWRSADAAFARVTLLRGQQLPGPLDLKASPAAIPLSVLPPSAMNRVSSDIWERPLTLLLAVSRCRYHLPGSHEGSVSGFE